MLIAIVIIVGICIYTIIHDRKIARKDKECPNCGLPNRDHWELVRMTTTLRNRTFRCPNCKAEINMVFEYY